MIRDEPYPVLRGGGWFIDPAWARVDARGRFEPSNRNRYLGFRLARVRTALERLADVYTTNEKE